MLYNPQDNGTTGSLHVLSAADGSLLSAIPGLSKGPTQARLSPSGNFVYEISVHKSSKAWVAAVDLKAGKVVRYIHTSPGYPYDLAVSPDGTKLFLATHTTREEVLAAGDPEKPDTSNVPVSVCPLSNGICVFDTTTFALTGYVLGKTGFLAIRQDGNSLYVWPIESRSPTLTIVNTASLAVSSLTIPQGQFVGAVTVSPVGHQAVILAGLNAVGSAYLLDTQANAITGSFPAPPVAEPSAIESNGAAFSRDGTSLWTLGACIGSPTCMTLGGQSFPSGETIAVVDFRVRRRARGHFLIRVRPPPFAEA